MRIVVAGTPDVAVPTLNAIAESEHEVVAVLTRPDAPLGRKRVLTPSPTAARADELGLRVIKSARPGTAEVDQLAALGPDLGVVVAYGAILDTAMLDVPKHGWINLHFSLLPKLRGAAPLQRAIMAGGPTTGISIFQLEEGLDTGPVYLQREHAIPSEATSGELLRELAERSTGDVLDVVNSFAAGTAVATPQSGEVTHAPKLTAADAPIDWNREARLVHAHIRAVTPEPGAVTRVDGARLKIHRVKRANEVGELRLKPGEVTEHERRVFVGCADEPIEVIEVQPAGKKSMPADAWWRGMNASDRVVLA